MKKLVAIVAIVFLCVVWGVPSRAEEGVTDTEILLGSTMDLSGPIAFMGKSLVEGVQLYFNYINDQGGVYGRKLRLLVEDDGYQPPRAVQGAKKLITKDKVFCMFLVLGSAQVNAMYPLMEEAGIPIVVPGTQNRDMAIPPRKYLFLDATHYTAQAKLAVQYIMSIMGQKNPKIACIYQDDAPGHDWRHGVQIATKYYKLDVLELPYKRGAVDFSSQMAKCKEAGITHVLIWSLVREPAIILKEAQRLAYKPTYIFANPSMNKKVIELAGADTLKYNSEIYATNLGIDVFRDKTPAVKLFEKNSAKYKMCSLDNSYHVAGYQYAITMVEGLKRTGKNLTREGLIKALETFKNYDNGFLNPITWGPNKRDGGNAIKMFKIVDGDWRSLTPGWIVSTIPDP